MHVGACEIDAVGRGSPLAGEVIERLAGRGGVLSAGAGHPCQRAPAGLRMAGQRGLGIVEEVEGAGAVAGLNPGAQQGQARA